MKNVGIIGFGSYVPRNRIKVSEIASVWGKNPEEISKSLAVTEKAVAGFDEDTVTMGIEAAQNALLMAKISPQEIAAVYVGSESHPYAVNPSATIIGEALGVGHDYLAADLEFACKAGTAGVQTVSGLLEAGMIDYGLAIGSDSSQSKPHDVLEYTAGAGAAGLILGRKKEEWLAQILDFCSYSSDTPDFWRRDGISYPSHQNRFTGEPAYFTHVIKVSEKLLLRNKMKPVDFAYCVFHMPNGKFPQEAAKRLGFKEEQLLPSLVVKEIGNPYSASALLGLCKVLETAKPQQFIFLTSYGSGAGSDSFILKTTGLLAEKRKLAPGVSSYIGNKQDIDYAQYLKFTKKI